MYAVYLLDKREYLRDPRGLAVLVFKSKKVACNEAARLYGFDTYTEAKRQNWVLVEKINKIDDLY